MDDTPSLAAQIAHRRAQLERYRAAYAETYEHPLDPAKHEAADGPLRALLAQEVTG